MYFFAYHFLHEKGRTVFIRFCPLRFLFPIFLKAHFYSAIFSDAPALLFLRFLIQAHGQTDAFFLYIHIQYLDLHDIPDADCL